MSLDYELLKRVKAALEELGPELDKQNDVPSTVVTAAAVSGTTPAPSRVLDPAAKLALREELRKKSTPELLAMFSAQARKKDAGLPFEAWASAGGHVTNAAIASDPILAKAMDTAGATALIRQDLEPVLIELYIREFPFWDRVAKEPANGLVHAYNRVTSFGGAEFMTELGTVTDSVAAYERATTPISILATRRGISLRSQFAVNAGGMNWNLEQLELTSGLRALAHKMQKTIFQGNATVSSGTASTEDGAYDVNGFDGLRKILNLAAAEDVDPTAGTPEDMRKAFNDAAITVMQAAGRVGVIAIDPIAKGQFDLQQDKNIRYSNEFVNVGVGVLTNAVNTVFGPLPLFSIPGDAIGEYTRSGSTVSDAYLLDESVISCPYLGSEGVTVLDIPIGVSGQLTHLFILFQMHGFAVKATQFNNKVRIKRPA